MAFNDIPAENLEYTNWAQVKEGALSDEERRRFKRLQKAVEAACQGKRPSYIAKKYGVSRSHLDYLVRRCAMRLEDGSLWGYPALLLGARVPGYERTAAIKPHDDGYGMAGALQVCFATYPDALEWLKAEISPAIGSGVRFKEAGLRMTTIHGDFIEKLRKLGAKADEWPFTVERMGYVSLVRYVNDLIDAGDDDLAVRKYGTHANDRLSTGSRKTGVLPAVFAFDKVAYDEYMLPDIATLVIQVQDDELDVPLNRAYFCPTVDFRSGAVLGYSVSVAIRFRGMDLVESIERSICPSPSPIKSQFFANLKVRPLQGFPAAVIPQARGRRICHLCVDNHLTHLSELVLVHMRQRTGMSISFGKVRHWITRHIVEGLFAHLQRSLSRLPSTTGSGPDDPAVNDPVRQAVKFRLRLEHLLELLDVLVGRYNAKPVPRLTMRSPNEVVAADWAAKRRLQIVPRYEESFLRSPRIAVDTITRTVRGSRSSGDPPYVQLDEAKYTNDKLQESWGLLGKELILEIGKDMRVIRAFCPNGSEFGVLQAQGKWGRTAHNRETRKEINLRYRQGLLPKNCDDPVTAYRNGLALEAALKQKTKRPKISRAAGELARSVATLPPIPGESVFTYKVEAERPRAPAPPMAGSGRSSFFSRRK